MSEVAKIPQNEVQDVHRTDDALVSMIERIAMTPELPIERLEKMLDMKERLDAKSAEQEFNAAFARAADAFPSIPLKGVGHNNKPYALLKDIIACTRPALAANGLALTFSTNTSKDVVVVTAKLIHRSGHSQSTEIELPRDKTGSKNDVQAIGSSQTYGQRYAAQAILGLSLGDDMDDDGQGAGRGGPNMEMGKALNDAWRAGILDSLPENASDEQKAEAFANAIISSFKGKGTSRSTKALENEWDRRRKMIENIESRFPAIHERIVDAYENRIIELSEER